MIAPDYKNTLEPQAEVCNNGYGSQVICITINK